ncbi:MAG: sulfurtransferase TusA family protein [Promethearchaeota archaeon]
MEFDYILDVNGKVCPMPAAETRKIIKKMQPGENVEIKGDFSLAIDNVIHMAEINGGKVLEKETGENYFRVLVKKI